MKLMEVFNQLTYGELSQISLGGAELGEINLTNYDKVVAHINLGLTALYTRFSLKEKQVSIPLQADANTYFLDMDDILKLDKVCTDTGYELGLNKSDDPYSCRTPTLKTLRVPQIILNKDPSLPDYLLTGSLTLTYRANHPLIDANAGSFDPYSYDMELPYSHLEPLLLFVASRVNNPIGMTNEFHAGNSYAAKYEAACRRLEDTGLQTGAEEGNERIVRNGWV